MSRGRGGPGAPVHSQHPLLSNADGLQISSALPCLTGGGSASQFCLPSAYPGLQGGVQTLIQHWQLKQHTVIYCNTTHDTEVCSITLTIVVFWFCFVNRYVHLPLLLKFVGIVIITSIVISV